MRHSLDGLVFTSKRRNEREGSHMSWYCVILDTRLLS